MLNASAIHNAATSVLSQLDRIKQGGVTLSAVDIILNDLKMALARAEEARAYAFPDAKRHRGHNTTRR